MSEKVLSKKYADDEFNWEEIVKLKYSYSKYNIEEIDNSLFKKVSDEWKSFKAESINSKPYSYWKSVGKTVLASKVFIICLLLIIIFVTMSLFIARGETPVPLDRPNRNPAAPSSQHLFGLGLMGEDLWNKMWIGTRSTLLFMVFIASIQIATGILIGLIWGYFSKLDILFIEIIRFLSMIPSLILWLLVIFIFGGQSTLWVLVLAISLTSWISMSSVIRIQTILVRNSEYNIASKVLGTNSFRIIIKNILPKILPIIIQTASFAIPNAIALDSLLSFYNFGFVSDLIHAASLGSILNEVVSDTTWQLFPHLLIIPISFISGISLLFFLVGKIFADSLDPKLHR
ncbi:oligopeptide ABC transporter permease [Spiroplasma helicoides]|uniref:Oligopeptide ABC transporter permease n=1 Tax=Spiroplasma helicoides TaxID=216938 RepID=A0A1B3SLV5_9MOLU|nr:oligopeptide ABC transporter permease OppC [Spiroplasma helicoides]AOG60915.1 oligopeptide ABC transporter permease [Spiroplasma helicoides]